ncbi:MAG: chemotaxis protein CheA, partial [Pseudomonadota bacterium]
AIREVFEFVEDDCELAISKAGAGGEEGEAEPLEVDDFAAPTDEPRAPEGSEPEASEPESSAPKPVESAPAPAAEATPEPKPAAAEPAAEPAASKPAAKAGAKASDGPKQTVRVDLDRIERLINLVGELVINQAMLTQRFAESELAHQTEVAEGLDEFKMLTRDIQESVMAIRAQPVKPLFQRMTRIIREAANATGKSVRLVSEGEGTEVDKTIVERLADPLTHMIRNAVDHGLEPPEAREAAGKPAEGVVRLIAGHRSGRIVIEVADDGAGINREKVREIAVSKGLIPEDAMLSDGEIDNLLFMPGFSTAKEVSDLSGRGVGMDVVKKAIQALGGRTSIASEPGKGTTFAISLPLTLAVLDGIVVSVADQTMVVPLTNIVETFRPGPEDVKGLGSDADVVLVRGQPLPIIDVGYNLGFRSEPLHWSDAVFIVTETHEGGQNALVVDEIFDQRQVVIKGLDANYGDIPGVAAATILGDGRIALILDVDVLVEEGTGGNGMQQLAMAG